MNSISRLSFDRRRVIHLVWCLGYYFTEMCSGSEAGSYARLIEFVYHSTLVLRVIKKKKKLDDGAVVRVHHNAWPLLRDYGTYKTVRTRCWS